MPPLLSEKTVHEYLEHLRDRGHSSKTVTQYRHKLLQFLGWLGDTPLTQRSLVDYRRALQERGLRPRTIRVAFTAIRNYFDYLRLEEGQEGLPDARAVKMPRMDQPERVTPTDSEMERIWRAAESMPAHTERAKFLKARTQLVLSLLRYCGLRRSELLGVNVADIRMDGDSWRVYVRKGKGDQSRWIPLCDEAREVVRAWLLLREGWAKSHACELPALIPIDRRRRLSHRGIQMLWAELMDRAGLGERHITPHGIRHYFATKVEEISDLSTTSTLLGHNRIETTLRYLHTDPSKMEQAVQRLGAHGAALNLSGPAGAVTPTGPVASPSTRSERSRELPRHSTHTMRRISRK